MTKSGNQTLEKGFNMGNAREREIEARPEYRALAKKQNEEVFAFLEDWFLAMENKSVHNRIPDPLFEPNPERPPITEAMVDELILELDRELDIDAFGTQGRKYRADAGCEFHRLAYTQRLALVQRLMMILISEEELGKEGRRLSHKSSGSLCIEV